MQVAGTGGANTTVVDSDFVSVSRVYGVALYKPRKGKETIKKGGTGEKRVLEATTKNYATEVNLWLMACSAEEKKSLIKCTAFAREWLINAREMV